MILLTSTVCISEYYKGSRDWTTTPNTISINLHKHRNKNLDLIRRICDAMFWSQWPMFKPSVTSDLFFIFCYYLLATHWSHLFYYDSQTMFLSLISISFWQSSAPPGKVCGQCQGFQACNKASISISHTPLRDNNVQIQCSPLQPLIIYEHVSISAPGSLLK